MEGVHRARSCGAACRASRPSPAVSPCQHLHLFAGQETLSTLPLRVLNGDPIVHSQLIQSLATDDSRSLQPLSPSPRAWVGVGRRPGKDGTESSSPWQPAPHPWEAFQKSPHSHTLRCVGKGLVTNNNGCSFHLYDPGDFSGAGDKIL